MIGMRLLPLTRAMWHSGLLLILLQLTAMSSAAEANVVATITHVDTGRSLANGETVQAKESMRFQCSVSPLESSSSSPVSYSWRLDSSVIGAASDLDLASASDLGLASPSSPSRLECAVTAGLEVAVAFVFIGQEADFDVNVEADSQEPLLGADLRVTCSASSNEATPMEQPINFRWFHNGLELTSATTESPSPAKSILVVNSVSPKLSDGTFGCLASSDEAKARYAETAAVAVRFGPVFESAPRDQDAVYGSAFVLKCYVAANPASTVTWTLNDRPVADGVDGIAVTANNSGSSLSVSAASQSSTGAFACKAENAVASSVAQATVRLTSDPPVITSLASEDEVLLLKGSSGVLDCAATGNPEPTSSWVSPTSVVASSPVLDLSSLSESDSGSWTCVATNALGQKAVKAVKVSVLSPTSILSSVSSSGVREAARAQLGSNFTLECKHSVDQRLSSSKSVTWTKDGSSLPFHTDSLLISPVSESSSGQYNCNVSTPFDFATETFHLEVVQSPAVKSFPKVHYVNTGGNVSIVCEATGIPRPQVEWTNVDDDSVKIAPVDSTTMRSVLSLSSVTRSSVLKCRATNDHGEDERTTRITVAAASVLAMENRTVTSVMAGSDATLNCSVSVDPSLSQTVQRFWSKDGKALEASADQLTIGYVTREHGGDYSCRVVTAVDAVVVAQTLAVMAAAPKVERYASSTVGVSAGSDVNVTCHAEGIPKPQVSWKPPSRSSSSSSPATITGRTLSIRNASVSDHDGVYTCMAVNEYGRDATEVRLNVYSLLRMIRPPQDTLANSLDRVVLQCGFVFDARLRDETRVVWSKDGQPVVVNDEVYVNGEGALVIVSALRPHQGSYTCSVSNSMESLNSTARLTVLGEPPSFLATEKDVRGPEAGNVTISCQANGLPIPKITWFRGNVSVVSGSRIRKQPLGDLTIVGVSPSDEGEYRCVASNIYGQVETTSKVLVIRKAVRDTADLTRESSARLRDAAVLRCDISSDPRVNAVTVWSKDDVQIDVEKDKRMALMQDKSLRISNVTLSDRGVYSCSVRTPFEAVTSRVALTVSGEPPRIVSSLPSQTLHEGDTLNVTCAVKGVPTPALNWYFNGQSLPKHAKVSEVPVSLEDTLESLLLISNVSKSDEGVYQCEASNVYGSGVAKFAKVSVVRRTSVDIAASGVISVEAGHRLKIPCVFNHDPLNRVTNIQWTKGGDGVSDLGESLIGQDRVDFGMDGSVAIGDVHRRHEGVYRCTVTTLHDSASAAVRVHVAVNAPVITAHANNNHDVFEGDAVSLSCNANGIPKPKITWTFNKTRVSSTSEGDGFSELLVQKTISTDAGHYVCTAVNEYGQTSHAFVVRVVGVAALKQEYTVKTDSRLELPCVGLAEAVGAVANLVWRKSGSEPPLESVVDGTLVLDPVVDSTPGVYTCSVTSSTGSKRTLTTTVRLKPSIITSVARTVTVSQGSDVSLDCDVLSGIESKRLWKHGGDYVLETGSRDIRKRGAVLLLSSVTAADAGSFTCFAITAIGQDSVEFKVVVIPAAISDQVDLRQGDCDLTKPALITEVRTLDNSSVEVFWTRSWSSSNASCFSGLRLTWWTNHSKGLYFEKTLPVEDKHTRSAIIRGLEEDVGYYVQLNLVAPLNVVVYGETRSFVLDVAGSEAARRASSQAEGEAVEEAVPVVVLGLVVGVLVLLAAVVAVAYCNRGTLVGKFTRKENGGKTNDNGFGNGIDYYDPRVVGPSPNNDFMQSLTMTSPSPTLPIQWPEPEPTEAHEADAFLPTVTVVAVPSSGHRRRDSKASISSSWSSLFNVNNEEEEAAARAAAAAAAAARPVSTFSAGKNVSFKPRQQRKHY